MKGKTTGGENRTDIAEIGVQSSRVVLDCTAIAGSKVTPEFQITTRPFFKTVYDDTKHGIGGEVAGGAILHSSLSRSD